jgi:hypothetical protein
MEIEPIATCLDCRETIHTFFYTGCRQCIEKNYSVSLDNKLQRVLTRASSLSYKNCSLGDPCEELLLVNDCLRKGHQVLIAPCYA